MHSRNSIPLALSTLLLSLGSCEALGGALPQSLSSIVDAAGGLSDGLGGLLGGLNVGEMLQGTSLDSLTGLIDTGKGLVGGLDGLPTEVTDKFSIDGLKGAIGSLTNFDVGGLTSATTSEGQSGFLQQLTSIAGNIGSEADVLKQQLSQG